MNCGYVEIRCRIVTRRRHYTSFPVDANALIAVEKLPAWIIQTALEMALCCQHPVNGAYNNEGNAQFKDFGHPWFPDLMLKGRLYDDRDLTDEVLIYYLEEEIGDRTIGVRWKLIVLDTMGVDIALLNLVATDNRHPQSFSESFG